MEMDCKKAFDRALLAAVLCDKLALIEHLVAAGADVNFRSHFVGRDEGSTPLILAAREGHRDCIEVLLRLGAEVNKMNYDGITPLMRAVDGYKEDMDSIRLLISSGASVNGVTRKGETALWFAARSGNLSTTKLLLESGASVNMVDCKGQSALLLAIKNDHVSTAKLLLESGASVNAVDRNRETPLYCAAKNGYLTAVKLLLESGADVSIANKEGGTAITIAGLSGHANIVNTLIESGADVNVRDNSTSTPLIFSYIHYEAQTVGTLIHSGADVNATDGSDWTTLMLTICGGDRLCIESLGEFVQTLGVAFPYTAIGNHNKRVAFMNSKAPGVFSSTCFNNRYEVDKVRDFGAEGQLSCLRLLLASGADLNHTTKSGWTALMIAALQGQADIVRLLLESGANANAVSNRNGWSALISAIVGDHHESVKLLIERGADVNVQVCPAKLDPEPGKSALGFALEIENGETIQLLLKSNVYTTGVVISWSTDTAMNHILRIAGVYSWDGGDRTVNLQTECREEERQHLLKIPPPVNLFSKVQRLGLPSRMEHFLLYNVSLD